MTTTGIKSFEHGLQTANTWLNDLLEQLEWDDRDRALYAMRTVLHALRDRLTVEETAHLSSQLPLLLRGVFFENWRPAHKPVKTRTKEEFLEHIEEAFQFDTTADPEEITRAVLTVISNHVSQGEIEDIIRILPKELQELWE